MCLLDKLENNLSKYQKQFEELNNDPQFRNIAFGSAGYLSKASKNRLYSQRERIGRVLDKIKLTELSIKIVNEELFNFKDIQDIYNNFLALRNPELGYEFQDEYFRIYKIAEMIEIIFNAFQVPYSKSILKHNMKYQNSNGILIDIPLEIAQ